MGVIQEIIDAVKEYDSFVISTHVSPEGDAIGAELGLALSLVKMGKKVSVINRDPVPEFLKFLPGTDMVKQADRIQEPHDVLVVVDCDPERTGLEGILEAPVKLSVNIDHHVTNPMVSDINWVKPAASAAGEMVYDILAAMDAPIDAEVATNLYTAIFTDTGSFRYSNTSEDALTKAGRLVAYGVNTWEISENVYETKSFARMKLLGLVLAGLQVSEDGMFAWASVTEEHFRTTGTSAEDIDGFINFPRAVKGVEVAILFREAGPGQVKVSFRSKGRVDVSKLAESLGGGGHPNAAGATMAGTLDEITARVLDIVGTLVKEPASG